MVLNTHPRDEGVAGLRGRQVQGQDVRRVPVEALQQLAALHVPQRARPITAGRQELRDRVTQISVITKHNYNVSKGLVVVIGFQL